MSVADKLLQVNQVKQDIKTAIETKGIPMTNVAFTEYANKILDISGGGAEVDEYFYYSKAYYTITNNSALFSNAWADHAKKTVYFDGDITFVATDTSLGFPLSFYTGAGIEELYNLMESGGIAAEEAVKLTIDGVIYDATSLDSITNLDIVLRYVGDVSDIQGVPTPVYAIVDEENNPFIILINTTNLGMPLGKALAFINNESINNLKIESGFNRYYENGVIIPDGVEVVPPFALNVNSGVDPIRDDFLENANIPLVISNSVTSIGQYAFSNWSANNQPLVIPEGVTSIGNSAFQNWQSNNHPLVIPNSVTTIIDYAFYNWSNVPYVEMKRVTPPTLSNVNAFHNKNDAPIYVPDASVTAYKNATNWSALASRIFPISEK